MKKRKDIYGRTLKCRSLLEGIKENNLLVLTYMRRLFGKLMRLTHQAKGVLTIEDTHITTILPLTFTAAPFKEWNSLMDLHSL